MWTLKQLCTGEEPGHDGYLYETCIPNQRRDINDKQSLYGIRDGGRRREMRAALEVAMAPKPGAYGPRGLFIRLTRTTRGLKLLYIDATR